jgi:hypothetical protein
MEALLLTYLEGALDFSDNMTVCIRWSVLEILLLFIIRPAASTADRTINAQYEAVLT